MFDGDFALVDEVPEIIELSKCGLFLSSLGLLAFKKLWNVVLFLNSNFY